MTLMDKIVKLVDGDAYPLDGRYISTFAAKCLNNTMKDHQMSKKMLVKDDKVNLVQFILFSIGTKSSRI